MRFQLFSVRDFIYANIQNFLFYKKNAPDMSELT